MVLNIAWALVVLPGKYEKKSSQVFKIKHNMPLNPYYIYLTSNNVICGASLFNLMLLITKGDT